jgi:hypothetical protein
MILLSYVPLSTSAHVLLAKALLLCEDAVAWPQPNAVGSLAAPRATPARRRVLVGIDKNAVTRMVNV